MLGCRAVALPSTEQIVIFWCNLNVLKYTENVIDPRYDGELP